MSKFKLLLISILAISIIYSCSKEEFNKLNTNAAAESKDIFSVNNSAAVKKCAIAFDQFLMHKDFKNNFLQDNGSPAWNFAFESSSSKQNNLGFRNGSLDSNDTYVIIPLILENSNFVSGFVKAKVNDTITFDLYRSIDYNYYSFETNTQDTINADIAATQIMWLNYKIFGWNRFISTDSRLFSSETVSSGLERIIQFREVEEHFVEGRLASVYVCVSIPNFAQGCTCPGNEGDFSTCSCTIRDCCWITNCDLLTFGDISSFPPVFPPGGGGTGSGGGGGSPPSPFPCPSLQGRAAAPPPGCGSTGNPPIYPAPPINILAMLTEYTTAINSASDIMVTQANNEHVEYGQTIVRHKTNSTIYAKNKKTDNQPDYVKCNHFVTSNEVLIGEEHVHPDDLNQTNPLDRSAPSMSDVLSLSSTRGVQNFVSFINCGNVRYALVIENLAVFAQFYRSNFRNELSLNQQANTIATQQPNWNANWQLATEVAILQLLGTNSGVSVYKSNNPEKTNFIKLN